jgi:hypothetical protein
MEILINESDLDITHKLNGYELKAWTKHLKHLQKEIVALEKMCALDVDGELEDKFVLQQLDEKRKQNNSLLKELEHYVLTKPNDQLCEDFQCDIEIISEHEKHRNNYLNYLMTYRKVKNKVFRLLRGKPLSGNNRDFKYG